MFTGLIETVGTLRQLQRGASGGRVTIASDLPVADLAIGDSVAVNGACLTVTLLGPDHFCADVSPETLACTTLGSLPPGAPVNLERALRLGGRLSGHLVTGHIDGMARVTERVRQGNAWRIACQLDPALARFLVAKGSIALDGVSLTVNEVSDDAFSVMVIPHTLEQTTLAGCRVGARMNVETDLIGKYVARLLGAGAAASGGVTMDLLAKNGFL
jgi:riboflavin synthase